jgi:hypothetical protein
MVSKSILIGSGIRQSRLLLPSDNNVKSSYWNLGWKIWKRKKDELQDEDIQEMVSS